MLPFVLAAMLSGCASIQSLQDPLSAGWKGQSVCDNLHDDISQRILRCTFPPGVGHERHYHQAHYGYIVNGGTMRVTDGNGAREIEIGTGKGFVSEGVAWHEALNIGDTTVVVLIMEGK